MKKEFLRVPIGENVTPPNEADYERAVLGVLLLYPETFGKIRSVIGPEQFYFETTRHTFELFERMRREGRPLDSLAVTRELAADPKFPFHDSANAFVIELMSGAATSTHAEYYAERIADLWQRREAVRLARDLMAAAHDRTSSFGDELVNVSSGLRVLQSNGRSPIMTSPELMAEGIKRAAEAVEQARNSGGQFLPGMRSQFARLDRQILGFHGGTVTIIGARPSMGKSAFLLGLAKGFAREGHAVHYISREDRSAGVADRLLTQETGINSYAIKTGRLDDGMFETLLNTAGGLSQLPIVWDFNARTLNQILRSIRRAHERSATRVVFIDYLQLLAGLDDRRGRIDRNQEIGIMLKELRDLARELDFALIIASQLSRALEARDDKRPRMSDLRDSGEIEQDADNIFFLYRPVVYDPDHEPADDAELLVRKVRDGKIGDVPLRFVARNVRFEERGDEGNEDA